MRRASLCLMRPGSSRTRAGTRTVSRGHALLGTPGVIAFALANRHSTGARDRRCARSRRHEREFEWASRPRERKREHGVVVRGTQCARGSAAAPTGGR